MARLLVSDTCANMYAYTHTLLPEGHALTEGVHDGSQYGRCGCKQHV